MTLRQYKFDPTVADKDRFVSLLNWRFSKSYGSVNDIVKSGPHVFSGEYPRNAWVEFDESLEGRSWWYYDRVDIGELLKNFKYPYINEEVVHFHGGLPHHSDEVEDWIYETFGLVMDKHEIYTNRKGSGGPYFQYNFVVKPESYTLTGSKQIWVRNKWKDHFDEFLTIFTLPDINTL